MSTRLNLGSHRIDQAVEEYHHFRRMGISRELAITHLAKHYRILPESLATALGRNGSHHDHAA